MDFATPMLSVATVNFFLNFFKQRLFRTITRLVIDSTTSLHNQFTSKERGRKRRRFIVLLFSSFGQDCKLHP